MDSYYATPLADELELDLISSFDGLGRFASSAPPSPALPSSVPSSVEGTPVQGTRELGTSQLQESSDYPLPFDRYVHAGAPPGAKLMDPSHAGSTSSTPVLIWTGAEKENVKKEKHVVGSIVNTEDNAKTPWPTSCLLFWPESRFSMLPLRLTPLPVS
ncbi:hypothetical protein CPB85DRAFT_368417 [Mucidula mucida]|nr:hypothetical protein CPB85DRAFT_368417 [Mucidula mucida]